MEGRAMEVNLISKETRHVFQVGAYRVDLFEEWSVAGRFFTLGIWTNENDGMKVVEKAVHASTSFMHATAKKGSVSFISQDPLRELYYGVTQKLLKEVGMDEAVADAIGKKVLELFILRKDCLI